MPSSELFPMKIIIQIITYCALTFSACNFINKDVQSLITKDSTLQSKATSILESKLSELNALSGQAIKLMEVQIKLFLKPF